MKIPQQNFRFDATTNFDKAKLSEFNAFVAKAAQPGAEKLVAKREGNDIVLFFKSDAPSSLLARISGKAAERRDLAKTALDQIVSHVEGNLGNKLKTSAKDILVELHNNVAGRDGHALTRDLKGILKNFAPALIGLNQADKALRAQTPPPQQQQAPKLETALPANLIGTTGANVQVDHNGQMKDLPKVQIGGNTYTPVKHLADGSFGGTFLYRNENNNNDVKVVKIPLDAIDADASKLLQDKKIQQKMQQFEQEVIQHANIGGGANRNAGTVAMEGAFRLPNGAPCLIMEHMPNGTLADFGKGLRALELKDGDDPKGKIPTKLADLISLSLLKDVATGVDGMHAQNLVDCDVKDENVMISADGHAKLCDFGELRNADDVEAHKLANTNPRYASPQLLQVSRAYQGDRVQVSTGLGNIIDNLQLSKEDKKKVREEMRNAIDQGYAMDAGQVDFDPFANDIYGIGTIATKLFTGQNVRPDDHEKHNDEIANYVVGYTNAVQPKNGNQLPDDALVAATGKRDVDNLLSGLLAKPQGQRLDPDGVLSHDALTKPIGVGNDAVHAFVPVAVRMISLHNMKTDVNKEKTDFENKIKGANRDPLPVEQNFIDGLNQQITQIENQMTALTPAFDTAKQQALDAINEMEVNAQIDEMLLQV